MQMASAFAQRWWRSSETRRRNAKSSKKPAAIGRPGERNCVRLSFESKRGGRVDSLVVAGWDRHHRTHETTERTLARPRALVIGGSVGGLFTAHLLRNVGWDVVVF